MRNTAFFLLVAAGLLWGTGGVTGHALAGATGLAAPAVAAYRIGLGGLVLVLTRGFGRRAHPKGWWRPVAVTAVLAAAFQACYFSAVALGTVSTATLVTIGSAPLFVLAAESRHRRPSLAELRPAGLGVLGLTLLIGTPAAGASLGSSLLGAGLAATSGATFAGFTLYRAKATDGVDEELVTGYGFLAGGLLLAAVTAVFTPVTFGLTARAAALLLVLATVPTALAYTLYFRGLAGATAAAATVVALLEPLTATVLAVTLFGDHLGRPGWFGAALLLLSVLDTGRQHARRPVRVGPAEPAL